MKLFISLMVVLVIGMLTNEAHGQPQDLVLARFRRFAAQPQENGRGNVDVDVHREKGVGTVVGVQADGNVWKSKNGNTRVDAEGSWSRVYHGPGATKPRYSAGVRLSHRW